MSKHSTAKGTLIIIGGGEDKDGDSIILQEIMKHCGDGALVVSTVASEDPAHYFSTYQTSFSRLGFNSLREAYVKDRTETQDPERLSIFDGVNGIFFTGGDQLRISSQIGDTPFEARVRKIYENGGFIAGTSAGASVLGEVMLVRGNNAESYKVSDIHLAPGLGILPNTIIDQHFAERGRIGRLLGAIAYNPRILGIGIDEDTAIVVKGDEFTVIGTGAVYIVDGSGVNYSNIAEENPQAILSIFDVRLHSLSAGDRFDLITRTPHT